MAAAKTPVAVLGATGMVGQRFVGLVADHPWFEVAALSASARSAGKTYAEGTHWILEEAIPPRVRNMTLLGPGDPLPCRWVFSALPGREAGSVETRLAEAGHVVCTNASALRMDPLVPLVIPEVNAAHLGLLSLQRRRGWKGCVAAGPNCTAAVLTLALCPLHRAFRLERVHAVSLQGLSGAGYPGVPSLDVIDNVLPRIAGEEEKVSQEPRKILGTLRGDALEEAPFAVCAQCNRVPVREGHLVCAEASFERPVSADEALSVLESFEAPETAGLPGAVTRPIRVTRDPNRPQPRLDRDAGGGMAVTVGRLRRSAAGRLRFVVLGHNTLRGAAGGTLLVGELLHSRFGPDPAARLSGGAPAGEIPDRWTTPP